MRIRKRTPARDADPGPAPALSASPPRPLPLQLQHPKERSREEKAEEKRVILVAGVRVDQEEGDRVAAASNDSSAMDDGDVPKPEPEPQPQPRESAAARCTRNDGKRWRCKDAAVPGYLFCNRHIAWSTSKRKPRPRKHRKQGNGGVLGPIAKDEEAASAAEDAPQPGHHDGGFQKRAKGGGFQKRPAA